MQLNISAKWEPEPAPDLEDCIQKAARSLAALQKPDGHFLFPLEADATIPAEYVLLTHYLGETPDVALEQKIGRYLRRRQTETGGWPLFTDGDIDISATVKSYFALKMIGHDPDAPHMKAARQAVLDRGGAANVNVFTRILLALYGIVPWSCAPQMPVEIMLLPRWFPFHLSKISYWARTVIVPLLVLQAIKPRAKNNKGVGIDELFIGSPWDTTRLPRAPHQARHWFMFFRLLDDGLRLAAPALRGERREKAIAIAVHFVTERLNGENGLGAIFPAMANAVMMFDALGVPEENPDRAVARASIDRLLLVDGDEAYCQPCLSPVWDSVLACHALLESGDDESLDCACRALDWLTPLQELERKGDWAMKRPNVRPGGWAFQYANPHYPDLDDTAVVAMAMERAEQRVATQKFESSISRAREWLEGLQSANGGWAAFDADNTHEFLNNIPFSDHGALLDPPSPDLTARCLSLLVEAEDGSATIEKALDYLRVTQREDGSWYGRWGVNYIYGTWSALCALNAAGIDHDASEVRCAASWLASIQNADGGWGEDCTSYRLDYEGHVTAPSTPSQTAWALLGLMAAGEVDHSAVENGIDYLLREQDADGLWTEPRFTGTGFPRVFYLRYHGYPKYFPLWAIARYRNLKRSNSPTVPYPI